MAPTQNAPCFDHLPLFGPRGFLLPPWAALFFRFMAVGAEQFRAVFCAVRRCLRGVGSSSEVVDDLGNAEQQQRREEGREGRYQHRQGQENANGPFAADNTENDHAEGYEGDCRRREADYAKDKGKNWLSVGAIAHGRRMPSLALV